MRLHPIRVALIACTMLVACQGTELTSPQTANGDQSEIAEFRDTMLSQALAIDEYLELLQSRPAEISNAPEEIDFRRYLDRQRNELRQASANPARHLALRSTEDVATTEYTQADPIARTDIFLTGPGAPRAVVTSRVSFPFVLIHEVSGAIETRGMSIPISFTHSSSPIPMFNWVTNIPLPEVSCSVRPAKVRVDANHFSAVVTKLAETKSGYTRSGAIAECGNPTTISCPSSGGGGNNERIAVSLRGPLPEPDPCASKDDKTAEPGAGGDGGAAAFVCFTTEHWVRVYTIHNGIVLGFYDQFLYAERRCYEVA